MSKGFHAEVLSKHNAFNPGAIVYCKVKTRTFRGITEYAILDGDTGKLLDIIPANDFRNRFEVIDKSEYIG